MRERWKGFVSGGVLMEDNFVEIRGFTGSNQPVAR
jgi:hypothetical protein